MHVEQRQRVHQDVVRRPRPGFGEGVERRGDRPPGEQDALRRAGGARGVDDQGRRLGVGGLDDGRADGAEIHRDPGEPGEAGGQHVVGPREHRRRLAVPEDVRELPLAGARIQRYGGDAREQGADDGDGRVRGGRRPHGDPPRVPDPRRERPGGPRELLVRQGVRAAAQRGPVGRGRKGREERTHRSSSSGRVESEGSGRHSAVRQGRPAVTFAASGAGSSPSGRTPRIRPQAYTHPASARSDSSMKPIEYESFAL